MLFYPLDFFLAKTIERLQRYIHIFKICMQPYICISAGRIVCTVCVFFSINLKQVPHGRQAFSGEPGRLRLNSSAHLIRRWSPPIVRQICCASDLALARASWTLSRDLFFLLCLCLSRKPASIRGRFIRDEILRHTPP